MYVNLMTGAIGQCHSQVIDTTNQMSQSDISQFIIIIHREPMIVMQEPSTAAAAKSHQPMTCSAA